MPEFVNSPIFLIVAGILGIFLLIAILKGALRLFIWGAMVAGVLIGLDILTEGHLREWFENLLQDLRNFD